MSTLALLIVAVASRSDGEGARTRSKSPSCRLQRLRWRKVNALQLRKPRPTLTKASGLQAIGSEREIVTPTYCATAVAEPMQIVLTKSLQKQVLLDQRRL